jgi:mRNA interferase HigB
MKVLGRERIVDFCAREPKAQSGLSSWLLEAESAAWKTPQDIKNRYRSASFLADKRVVFNIGGNKYRLLVKVSYKNQVVLVERVGTHSEYDGWKV